MLALPFNGNASQMLSAETESFNSAETDKLLTVIKIFFISLSPVRKFIAPFYDRYIYLYSERMLSTSFS